MLRPSPSVTDGCLQSLDPPIDRARRRYRLIKPDGGAPTVCPDFRSVLRRSDEDLAEPLVEPTLTVNRVQESADSNKEDRPGRKGITRYGMIHESAPLVLSWFVVR